MTYIVRDRGIPMGSYLHLAEAVKEIELLKAHDMRWGIYLDGVYDILQPDFALYFDRGNKGGLALVSIYKDPWELRGAFTSEVERNCPVVYTSEVFDETGCRVSYEEIPAEKLDIYYDKRKCNE